MIVSGPVIRLLFLSRILVVVVVRVVGAGDALDLQEIGVAVRVPPLLLLYRALGIFMRLRVGTIAARHDEHVHIVQRLFFNHVLNRGLGDFVVGDT